jgi:hypothetical protein
MPQGQAQAMPEDTGIAQLPAGNMNFAEGGIISFAGEGPSLVQDMSPDAINERYRQKQWQQMRDFLGITGVTRGSQSGMTPEEKQSGITVPQASAAPVVPPAPAAPPNVPPADTTLGAKTPPPPRADAGIKNLLAPRAPAAAPARSFMERYEASRKDRTVTDPYADQETALQTEETAAAKRRISELDADTASRGDAYAGRKERVDKREGELEKSRATNEGMAFLEAGLAMMQSKGRGLAGIAQGAGVGVKAYGTGIEKLKLAQEKLDEARDKIDSAQDTENQLTKRERRGLLADADKTATQGKRAYLSAQRKLLSEDEALLHTAAASDAATANSQAELASKERIANAAANRSLMADERASEQSRLASATAVVKAAQATLKDTANSTPDDIATAKRDYEAGMAVLRRIELSPAEKATVAKYLK